MPMRLRQVQARLTHQPHCGRLHDAQQLQGKARHRHHQARPHTGVCGEPRRHCRADRPSAIRHHIDCGYACQQRGRRHRLPQRCCAHHPKNRPATEQKEAGLCQCGPGLPQRGRKQHTAGQSAHGARRHHMAEAPARENPRGQQRADHHARAVHAERQPDRLRSEVQPLRRIRDEDGRHHEEGHGEDKLRDEHRPQQRMLKHEARAFGNVSQRVRRTPCHGLLSGHASQHCRSHGGQRRRQHERRHRACPADQRAADGRPAGKCNRARQLDAAVCAREHCCRHERRHQRGRRHAEHHRAAHRNEAQHAQRSQVQPPGRQQARYNKQGQRAHGLRVGHQCALGPTVRQHADGNGKQHERQRERHL
jgi:hypothetical protein